MSADALGVWVRQPSDSILEPLSQTLSCSSADEGPFQPAASQFEGRFSFLEEDSNGMTFCNGHSQSNPNPFIQLYRDRQLSIYQRRHQIYFCRMTLYYTFVLTVCKLVGLYFLLILMGVRCWVDFGFVCFKSKLPRLKFYPHGFHTTCTRPFRI
jgi:hypothetical protein